MAFQSSCRPIVTLLTDFQPESPYQAQMKGVLYSKVPEVQVVDVTHAVPPQEILYAAFLLDETAPFFPPGTIHIVVVDPGVGSDRELLCVQADDQIFLCPNNGILSAILSRCEVQKSFRIQSPSCRLAKVSATFHGRDILAPTAAFLALGGTLEEVGPSFSPSEILRLPLPTAEWSDGRLRGEILFEDSFGNLITSLTRKDVPEGFFPDSIQAFPQNSNVSPVFFRFVRTYSDAPIGERVALFGSQGHLELAIVNGSAAKKTFLKKGDSVESASVERRNP